MDDLHFNAAHVTAIVGLAQIQEFSGLVVADGGHQLNGRAGIHVQLDDIFLGCGDCLNGALLLLSVIPSSLNLVLVL